MIFSMMETAKENRLDPYRCLVRVLQSASNLEVFWPGWAERLLPENAPEECRNPPTLTQNT